MEATRKSKRNRNRKPIETSPSQSPPPNASLLTPAGKRVDLRGTPAIDTNNQLDAISTPRRKPNAAAIPLSFTSPAPSQDQAPDDFNGIRGIRTVTFDDEDSSDDVHKPNAGVWAAASTLVKKEALQQLFSLMEKDPILQRQWWPLQTLTFQINRLNALSIYTQLVPTVPKGKSYDAGKILAELRRCCAAFVAEDPKEFDSTGKNQVFLRTFRFGSKRETAIYVDLEAGKCDYQKLDQPYEWFQGLLKKRHSIVALIPPKFYSMINPWYSTEFDSIFASRNNETAREAAEKCFTLLRDAQQTNEAAKALTDGLQQGEKVFFVDGVCGDDEPVELKFDPLQVERLACRHRMMATYIKKALAIALDVDAENNPLAWGRCCQEAVNQIQSCTGINTLDSKSGGATVEAWFRSFKTTRLFDNPLLLERYGINFFLNNAGSAQRIKDFGNNNLEHLTADLVHAFILDKEIPRLVNKRRRQESMTKKKLLQESGLHKLCANTVRRWMLFLGFRRDKARKSFYTDNHEREDVIRHRIDYCLEFFKLEKRAAVWVHLTPDRVNELKSQTKPRIWKENKGKAFEDDNGNAMLEFHVDDIIESCSLPELLQAKLGGYLSHFKDPNDKQVFMWGQDEVVCHEKQLNSMTWYGTDGQQALRPKDKGAAMHISGVLSREAGWMATPTEAQLIAINNKRSGTRYISEEAAIDVNGAVFKRAFTWKDISVRLTRWTMQPGVNKDGYWRNNHALIQLEDVMDVVNTMFPNMQHIIYYDHSQGHKAKRKDGLDAARLNKGFGGEQPKMRDTELDSSCIGTFCGEAFNEGDTQSLVFQLEDEGPCWMSPQEQVDTKYDEVYPGEVEKVTLRTKKHIYAFLKPLCPVDVPASIDSVSLATLREIAKKASIKLQKEEPRRQIGWVGQPKGAFQICYERGLINMELEKPLKYYTMDGRKGDDGKLAEGTGLRQLLSSCGDFKREISMLEHVAMSYGWLVLFSPKCHPEIAGMGIEYVWGTAKSNLNRIPLVDRKGFDKFSHKVLDQCFSTAVLTSKLVRSQARQARGYMIGYLMMHAAAAAEKRRENNAGEGEEFCTGSVSIEELKASINPIACEKIKKARKSYKRHRGIACFESGGGIDGGGFISYTLPTNL